MHTRIEKSITYTIRTAFNTSTDAFAVCDCPAGHEPTPNCPVKILVYSVLFY